MNSLKSLFPDREGYVIMLTVLHKTRRDFMAENNFDSTVASLFKGMDAFISAKTVLVMRLRLRIQLSFRLLMFRLELEQERLQGIRRIMPVVE